MNKCYQQTCILCISNKQKHSIEVNKPHDIPQQKFNHANHEQVWKYKQQWRCYQCSKLWFAFFLVFCGIV